MVATFAQVLAVAPTNATLTEEIQAKLGEAWNDRPVAEIVAGGMIGLANDLATILPDYDRAIRLNVAEALMSLFEVLRLTTATPQVVKVKIEKTPDQMSLRELLEYINEDPARYHEVWRYIASDPTANNAAFMSKDWVIPNADGRGIDVDLTLTYATYLTQTGAFAQVEYRGRRPTHLRHALGMKDSKPRPLVHVLLWQPVLNLDALGYDWSKLDPEIIESIVWAQSTGHRALPGSYDPYIHTPEIFAETLPPRWQQILDDYKYLKEHDPESVRGITAYWDDYQKRCPMIVTAAPVRQVPTSEDLVRAACLRAGTFRHFGSHATLNTTGVYEQAFISGSHNCLDLILIWGGQLTGDHNQGDVYMPPGMHLEIKGDHNRVNQHHVDWDLLRHRGRVS